MDGRTSNEWRVAKQQPQQKPSEALGLTDHIDSAGLGLTSWTRRACAQITINLSGNRRYRILVVLQKVPAVNLKCSVRVELMSRTVDRILGIYLTIEALCLLRDTFCLTRRPTRRLCGPCAGSVSLAHFEYI